MQMQALVLSSILAANNFQLRLPTLVMLPEG